jgi:hypothetical protein
MKPFAVNFPKEFKMSKNHKIMCVFQALRPGKSPPFRFGQKCLNINLSRMTFQKYISNSIKNEVANNINLFGK